MTTTPNCRIRSTSLELLEIHPMAVEATSSVPGTRHTCLTRSAPREHGSQIGAFAPCASQRGVNQSSANKPQGSDPSVLNAFVTRCSLLMRFHPGARREERNRRPQLRPPRLWCCCHPQDPRSVPKLSLLRDPFDVDD